MDLKRALLSGISVVVPVIIAGGTILAAVVLITQILGLQELDSTETFLVVDVP